MPIPKNVTFVTFDVYGTLIDWETGIYDAFAKEAARDGFEIDRDVLIPLFHEISREIEGGSYELYAEVLRRTAIEIAKRLDWPLEPSRSGFLPDSVQRWPPFKETNTQLQKLAKKYKLGLLSNIDDKLLGQTRRHIPIDFDLVVTAQQVRSYKPELAHFTECARRMGGKHGWVHVAASHYHDVVPCVKQRVPGDLGQPQQGDARLLPEEADGRGAQPARGRQAARRHLDGRAVRAVALHRDVLVVTSALLQRQLRDRARRRGGGRTRPSATASGGGETFVIDSPVLPDELDALPALLEQARLPAAERAAGHARRLGPPARPARLSRRGARAAPRAPPSACAAAPGEAQRELRAFDEELLIERPRPLALGSVQALPVPGRCDVGERELELHPAGGHTADGMAVVVAVGGRARRRRLPLAGRDPDAARRRLARRLPGHARAPARRWSARAEHVVPGHGPVLDGAARARASSRRTSPTCWRCASAAPRPSCPPGAAAREQRAAARARTSAAL